METLLLIADEKIEKEFMKQMIEMYDSHIEVIAEVGDEVLACELVLKYRPDIVLLDIQTLTLEANQTVKKIISLCPELWFVIFAACDTFFTKSLVKKRNFLRHVPKPGCAADVLPLIKEAREQVKQRKKRIYGYEWLHASLTRQVTSIKTTKTLSLSENAIQYPFRYESMLLEHIRCGEWEKGQEILAILLKEILSQPIHLELIKMCLLELVIVASRAAIEGGAEFEQITLLDCACLEDLQACYDEKMIISWISRVFHRIMGRMKEYKGTMNRYAIEQACQYIIKNYSKNISLEEVSQVVHLSPSYFCRLFKQERGYNFVDFLTKVRIETAKKMLRNSNDTTVRIATAIGYKDASYFIRIFKQTVEMTPNQYRNANRVHGAFCVKL
ncbi:MAG: DNA-binding response regulator [Sporomusaceae bacterium]|nr:DNA-binding response regulator [Sporomusaceae bacterium]